MTKACELIIRHVSQINHVFIVFIAFKILSSFEYFLVSSQYIKERNEIKTSLKSWSTTSLQS